MIGPSNNIKPRDVNKRSRSLPGKLDIKRHSPGILYLFPVPSAPSDLNLRRKTSTSLTFRWKRPLDAKGNTTVYTIIYWKNVRELSIKKGVEWRSSRPVVEYTLTGLEPYTSYNIQVNIIRYKLSKQILYNELVNVI